MPDGNRVAVAQAGAIAPLVVLLTSGTQGAKEGAAAALCNISCNNDDDQGRVFNRKTARPRPKLI